MRFIDSNIFIHAWLKPKRELNPQEKAMKENSKKILLRVENGEPVVTSIIHISEIANILESKLNVEKSIEYIEAILSYSNIRVADVSFKDFILAIDVAREYKIGLVDAVALVIMKKMGLNEIYTQDSDFRKTWVKIVNT